MKISKKILSIFAISVALFSCTTVSTDPKLNMLTDEQLEARENTNGVFWYQTSVEAKALYLQGYKLATKNLTELLKKPHTKPYAIVLDLDETVMDNSPYQVQNIRDGVGFSPKTWDEWVYKEDAKVVPGAAEFLQFADKNKVQIYYVSNRSKNHYDATIRNLKKYGVPIQSKEHLLFDDKGSKVQRMAEVAKHGEIVMLFGDNFTDFGELSKKSLDVRNKQLEELKDKFGDKFIIFPNPMYGSFDRALFKQVNAKTAKDKMNAKQSVMKGYK